MMKYTTSKLTLLSFLMIISFGSCHNDEANEPDLPEWNKERTATIKLYSNLNGTALFLNEDYSSVVSNMKASVHQVTVLDKANITYNATQIINPSVAIAADVTKVPLFVCNSVTNTSASGTGILLNHTYSSSETKPISATVPMLSVDTQVNASIPMTFAFISLAFDDQVAANIESIKSYLNDKTVLVGTADKASQDILENSFNQKDYRIDIIEGLQAHTTESVFVLTTHKWVVREVVEVKINTTGVSCFDIKIEALK